MDVHAIVCGSEGSLLLSKRGEDSPATWSSDEGAKLLRDMKARRKWSGVQRKEEKNTFPITDNSSKIGKENSEACSYVQGKKLGVLESGRCPEPRKRLTRVQERLQWP